MYKDGGKKDGRTRAGGAEIRTCSNQVKGAKKEGSGEGSKQARRGDRCTVCTCTKPLKPRKSEDVTRPKMADTCRRLAGAAAGAVAGGAQAKGMKDTHRQMTGGEVAAIRINILEREEQIVLKPGVLRLSDS